MEQFDTAVLDTIEELASHFQDEVVAKWAANIRRQKIMNTRQLLNSLDAATEQHVGRMVIAMQFAFQEYGRYIDIRKKRWSHQPPVDKIIEWIEKRGLQSFGPDPKPNKKKPKTPERRKNEIAWGTARQYKANDKRNTSKAWMQSTFYKSLNALYDEIALGVSDRSMDAMRESLTARLKRGSTGKYI